MKQLPTRVIQVIATLGVRQVVVKNVFIEFEYNKTISSKPDEGTLKIYNLKPTTSRFIKSAERIKIIAGYTANSGLVFDGDIRKATNKRKQSKSRQGLNHLTEVFLGGNVKSITDAYFQRSYKGVVTLKQIVIDAIPSFTLSVKNLNTLPDITLEDFTWSGRTKDLLDEILKATEFGWFEESGVITFHKTGDVVDFKTIVVKESTGLLSTPEIDNKGIKFKTLLNPAYRIGGLVKVESIDTSEANGLWKIKKINIRGNNRDGEHTSELKGIRYAGS